jgi:hypothetical protein
MTEEQGFSILCDMSFGIGSINIAVTSDGTGIRLQTDSENILLVDQSFEVIEPIVLQNFDIVRKQYQRNAAALLSDNELDELAIKIAFSYLALYNTWRTVYPKEKDRDLTFLPKDFDSPMTYDLVTAYIRKKFPKDYREKCAVVIGISVEEYMSYEKARQEFIDIR